MGQAEDSAGLAERYDEARAWLAFLIDHPDKSVSVAEYKNQIRAARTAIHRTHKALMAGAGDE